ncbi:MAG TPA: nucleotidyl transferase AbiEii/AbiGii toxin family protein [Bacteroidales bacterium]|nr:nucleotidyl transferase AbiEii/AbiGii toxin family protein [Bacteroidales bacterium]
MSADYYLNKLYPLQDRFMQMLNALSTDFYLTGGTALSRFYLQHRYSDDLDFFANQSQHFRENIAVIINRIDINYEIGVRDEHFVRILCKHEDCHLKIDFVNDVPFHSGAFIKTAIFDRIDNPLNILSNKISALQRNNPKDIADIVLISEKYNFNWMEIIKDAQQKDLWVNPLDVALILESFPAEQLREVKWISPPDINVFSNKIKLLIQDIIKGKKNSLFKLKP